MATYCIGDVQGCYDELKQLLRSIDYNSAKDHLWFIGDLVNRGPKSLEALRFIKNSPNTKVILGNHDLHLLTFYYKLVEAHGESLQDIILAPDGEELIDWLRQQSLFYYDAKNNYALAHAGIYPGWDLKEAQKYAAEAEKMLQGDNYLDFLTHMYGNKPTKWSNDLKGWDRLRFIINAFTRMRFCNSEGNLEFKHSGDVNEAPKGYLPWFKISGRKTQNTKVIFGHWAALEGITDEPNAIALDTGCVWGKSLTAIRIEDGKRFSWSPRGVK
jgi:bis(5'-nucleosyl)-tetraphosphatase (symmetrical)